MTGELHIVSPGLGPATSLPILQAVAKDLADFSGLDWNQTSFIRPDSIGHSKGDSLDIAPLPRSRDKRARYGRFQGTDPVLHLRPALLNTLMKWAAVRRGYLEDRLLHVIVAIENDHLHLQLARSADTRDAGRIILLPHGQDMTSRYPDSRIKQAKKLTTRS